MRSSRFAACIPELPSRRRWLRPSALLASAGVMLCCCKPAPNTLADPQPAVTPAAASTRVLRSLLREANRAEVREHGLFIDFGTPDQHKYIRGGWLSGWGKMQARPISWTMALPRATVYADEWFGGIQKVLVRARALRGQQSLRLVLDGQELTEQRVPEGWTTLSFPLDQPSRPGRHTLQLRFSHPAPAEPAALVDWIWLTTTPAGVPRAARTGIRVFGDPRNALLAEEARTYSFFLEVPPRARLTFAVAARRPAEFQVSLRHDGAPAHQLFQRAVRGGPWARHSLDLSSFAGQTARLDLRVTGHRPEAAWAEPALVTEGAAAPVPPILPAQRARNLIFIVTDATRQDAFRAFTPAAPTQTPAMDRLAREGTIFTNAHVVGNWTYPSVASMFTGRYLSGYLERDPEAPLSQHTPLLQRHLKHFGFATAAFTTNLFHDQCFPNGVGWDVNHEAHKLRQPVDASSLFDKALAWIKKHRDRRFFVHLHTFDNHVPYIFQPEHVPRLLGRPYRGKLHRVFDDKQERRYRKHPEQLTAEDRRYLLSLYLGTVEFQDLAMDRFLEALAASKLLENTLLVFTNDHGEELLDHGSLGHGHSLFRELLLTPLALRYPPLFPPGRSIDQIVDAVDLLPTMLESLGVPPMPEAEGQSLRGAVHGRDLQTPPNAFSEGQGCSLRLGPYHLILTKAGQELFFDLRTDPKEQHNLAGRLPIARRTAELHLSEAKGMPQKDLRLSGMAERPNPVDHQAVMDPEQRKRLKALGYLR